MFDNDFDAYPPDDTNELFSDPGILLQNVEEYNGPQFVYIRFQKLIYQSIYREDCIYAKPIEDMVSLTSTKYKQMFSQRLLKNIDIYIIFDAPIS